MLVNFYIPHCRIIWTYRVWRVSPLWIHMISFPQQFYKLYKTLTIYSDILSNIPESIALIYWLIDVDLIENISLISRRFIVVKSCRMQIFIRSRMNLTRGRVFDTYFDKDSWLTLLNLPVLSPFYDKREVLHWP